MMEPPPASFSRGRNVWATMKGPLRLVSRIMSQSASVIWSKSVGLLMPALLTRMEVGDIHRHRMGLAAKRFDFFDHGFRLSVFFAIGEHDICARPRQAKGNGG